MIPLVLTGFQLGKDLGAGTENRTPVSVHVPAVTTLHRYSAIFTTWVTTF